MMALMRQWKMMMALMKTKPLKMATMMIAIPVKNAIKMDKEEDDELRPNKGVQQGEEEEEEEEEE